ncbi:MAG: DUF853 family protein, partial [Clostridiales bacterium]|nr:DUF853 family protein [Clostridiales bacterium]
FFFDEAHLLFKNASKTLMEKIEQVIKLIRSKGVSIFFVTQSPGDIPNAVMSQLGNKIEHGLHAYTPAEQRVVRAAADAFRVNPDFDTEELILNLGTGEAVVSTLDEKGAPSVAQHAFILPPESRMGPLSDEERSELIRESILNSKYETMVDNVSAYEVITGKAPAVSAEPVPAGGGYTYSADFNTPVQTVDRGNDDISIDIETSNESVAASQASVQQSRSGKVRRTVDDSSENESSRSIGDMADNLLGKSGTRQVVRSTGGTIGREIGKSIGEAVLGKKGRTIGGNIGSALGRNLFGTLIRK